MAIVFQALMLMEMLWQLATQGMTNMLQRFRGTAGLTATVAMVLEDGAAMSAQQALRLLRARAVWANIPSEAAAEMIRGNIIEQENITVLK
jgi:hypothetical protein